MTDNWYKVLLPEVGYYYLFVLDGKPWLVPEAIVHSWECYRNAADSAEPIINKYMEGLKSLENMVSIQTTDGNWNYSEYMHGMANGLLGAASVFSGEDVVLLTAPEQYLCDKEPTNDRPTIAD